MCPTSWHTITETDDEKLILPNACGISTSTIYKDLHAGTQLTQNYILLVII